MSDSRPSNLVVPAALRAAVAGDLQPVRPLPPPLVRALWLAPFAVLLLLAAPSWFNLRHDYDRIGFVLGWGTSLLQVVAGLLLAGAGLRESVPGRAWSRTAVVLWLIAPVLLVSAVTAATWSASHNPMRGPFAFVALMCGVSSFASGTPAVLLGVILAYRAYPTRPAIAGAMLGFGAGLMADAGWRMFCDYADPAHVLAAHLGGVLAAALMGASLGRLLGSRYFRTSL